MAVPLKYNLRNLVARKASTGMTAFVIGLVVAVFLCVLALVSSDIGALPFLHPRTCACCIGKCASSLQNTPLAMKERLA